MNKSLKYNLILIGIIISVSITWYIKNKQRVSFPSPIEIIQKSQSNIVKRTPSHPNGVNLKKNISIKSKTKTSDELSKILPPPSLLTLNQICLEDWKKLVIQRDSDLQVQLERTQLLLSSDCIQKMIKEIKIELIQSFIKNCQLALSKKSHIYIQDVCFPQLSSFKSLILHNLDKSQVDFNQLNSVDLINQFNLETTDLKKLNENEIERTLQLADAIIAKDPDYYPAYKTKLITLLIQEIKFKKEIALDQYDSLYDDLLSFQSNESSQYAIEPSMDVNEDFTILPESSSIDSDLLHLPFLRLSALNDWENLEFLSQEYIESYPKSYIGYYYLAQAEWKAGDHESSAETLKKMLSQNTTDEGVLNLLNKMSSLNPLDLIINSNGAPKSELGD